jgi:hypothetical protein
MRKFLLIEGYRIGENELNEETPKEKYQSLNRRIKNMDE